MPASVATTPKDTASTNAAAPYGDPSRTPSHQVLPCPAEPSTPPSSPSVSAGPRGPRRGHPPGALRPGLRGVGGRVVLRQTGWGPDGGGADGSVGPGTGKGAGSGGGTGSTGEGVGDGGCGPGG